MSSSSADRPEPASRRSRLQHDERRAQILAVARRLFCERPYAAVSNEEIAKAAGVARGLLHHYFGTKRDLYLEVVADLLQLPDEPVAPPQPGRPLEVVIEESVDRWLAAVDRYRTSWFATTGAGGFGRDPEIEALVAQARDRTVAVMVTTLGLADHDGPTLRAVLRAYAGLAEATTREWLQTETLNRDQAHALLSTTLVALVRDVTPAVEEATAPTGTS